MMIQNEKLKIGTVLKNVKLSSREIQNEIKTEESFPPSLQIFASDLGN